MLLKNELIEITQLVNQAHKKNVKVSEGGIDWHLDHLLKVILSVFNVLKKSNPLDYKSNFNFLRFCIFTLNFMPKGKVRAPRSVCPPDTILQQDILKQLEDVKQQLNSIKNLPTKSNFKHPYFGLLNLKQTIQFLGIHTNHHLKICRNINKLA